MGSAPMFGRHEAIVLQARAVSIHGDVYYDAALRLTDQAAGEPLALRIPSHACVRPPEPGDRVRVSFLMGQVDALEFA